MGQYVDVPEPIVYQQPVQQFVQQPVQQFVQQPVQQFVQQPLQTFTQPLTTPLYGAPVTAPLRQSVQTFSQPPLYGPAPLTTGLPYSTGAYTTAATASFGTGLNFGR